MRNFSAMTIMAMLASATLVNSAFCASARWSKNTVGVPPYQYGWWDKDQWRGGWGPGGRWMRHGHQWVYRWRG